MNEIRRFLYGLDFPNVTENQLISRYQKHNNDVVSFFETKKNQLSIVDWESGDGWRELCEFLEMDIPQKAFPHSNKGIYNKDVSSGRFQKLSKLLIGKKQKN